MSDQLDRLLQEQKIHSALHKAIQTGSHSCLVVVGDVPQFNPHTRSFSGGTTPQMFDEVGKQLHQLLASQKIVPLRVADCFVVNLDSDSLLKVAAIPNVSCIALNQQRKLNPVR